MLERGSVQLESSQRELQLIPQRVPDPNSAYADYLRSFTEVPPEQLPSSLPPSSVATPLAQFAPTSTVATPNQLEAAVSILAMSHAAPSPDSPAVPPEPSMEDQESVSVAQEDIAVV